MAFNNPKEEFQFYYKSEADFDALDREQRKLNPFNWPKMYSESRDYKAINNFISDYNDKYPESYLVALEQADSKSSLDPIKESIKESIENIRELERARAKEQEQTAIDFGKDLDNAKDEPVTAKIEESEAPIATNAKK